MTHVARWIPSPGAERQTSKECNSMIAAMDYACAVLPQRPFDIWIEDEVGQRVAGRGEILEHCQQRAGSLKRPRRP